MKNLLLVFLGLPLVLSAQAQHSVTIGPWAAWTQAATGSATGTATQILVMRAGPDGIFLQIASLPVTATSYTDTSGPGNVLTEGVSYSYELIVVGPGGWSDVTLTTPPSFVIPFARPAPIKGPVPLSGK